MPCSCPVGEFLVRFMWASTGQKHILLTPQLKETRNVPAPAGARRKRTMEISASEVTVGAGPGEARGLPGHAEWKGASPEMHDFFPPFC